MCFFIFRNSKDQTCTNAQCGTVGQRCMIGQDCCGDLSCSSLYSASNADTKCIQCIQDGQGPCKTTYDCCGSMPLYMDIKSLSYSYCRAQATCEKCKPVGSYCDGVYDECCGKGVVVNDMLYECDNNTCIERPLYVEA